jgi:hypothetical protein
MFNEKGLKAAQRKEHFSCDVISRAQRIAVQLPQARCI